VESRNLISTYILSDEAALKRDPHHTCPVSFLLFALHTVVLQPAFTCGCPLFIEVLPDIKWVQKIWVCRQQFLWLSIWVGGSIHGEKWGGNFKLQDRDWPAVVALSAVEGLSWTTLIADSSGKGLVTLRLPVPSPCTKVVHPSTTTSSRSCLQLRSHSYRSVHSAMRCLSQWGYLLTFWAIFCDFDLVPYCSERKVAN
jgi:hypothetical protein